VAISSCWLNLSLGSASERSCHIDRVARNDDRHHPISRSYRLIYCLPALGDMNAYALGGSEGAAIVLTEGLLRRMTWDEIAGILAHEVAHIRNNDIWTMSWAAALHRAIEWTSLTGLALLRALRLALSRTRELDADGTALELTGDPQALIAALDKLERHHAGFPALPVAAGEDGPTRLLRSHPATSERVGALLSLAY
jgi:heat shock protein HtpX